MQDLYAELDGLTDALMRELETVRTSGCQYAENEAAYRKALRVEILRERDKGTPVTVIADLCRGLPRIANLKCRRDCSEAIYKASQEAVNVYKLRMRMVNDQLARVWNSGSVPQAGEYL